MKGSVFSGPPSSQVPIFGSTVDLYEAFANGLPGCKVASTKTTKRGIFKLGFRNRPNPNAILYLVASQGSAGGNKRSAGNAAIKLMSVLVPPFPKNKSVVTLNELTTLAAAYDLSNFFEPGNVSNLVDNSAGFLGTAIQAIPGLVNFETGASGTILSGSYLTKFHTLANALANCVRSPSACNPQFPDTLAEAIQISKSPQSNVAEIFQAGESGPYTPSLAAQPNDWIVALTYSSAALGNPEALAIDGSNNVWVASDGGIVSELPALDRSAIASFSVPALTAPTAIGIDGSENIWITNGIPGASTVFELCGTDSSSCPSGLKTGELISPAQGFPEGGAPLSVSLAIDQKSNVWIANTSDTDPSGSVIELPAGLPTSPNKFSGGDLLFPTAVAVDSVGNIWVANQGNVSLAPRVVELCGANLAACPPGFVTGESLAPNGGFTSSTFASPAGVVLDQANNAWISNSTSPGSVTELPGSNPSSSMNFVGGDLDSPVGLCIDGVGNVWVANTAGSGVGSVTEIPVNNPSVPLGFQSTAPTQRNLAIDGGGNVWIANTAVSGGSPGGVTEFLGAAAPVITPVLGPPSAPAVPTP